jgi:predicted DNA-binding ribbon-helix-helix protein
MRSTGKLGTRSVNKRSIIFAGRKTSVNVEDAFWDGLKEIAVARNIRLQTLVTEIDSKRQHPNLSSAIRLFVLDFYQAQMKQPRWPFQSPYDLSEHHAAGTKKCPAEAGQFDHVGEEGLLSPDAPIRERRFGSEKSGRN